MMLPRTAAIVLCTGVLLLAGCDGGVPGAPSSPPSTSPSNTPATPLISIDSPAEGATTRTPIELSGTANTFEAALTVDVVDGSGTTLCVRSLTATSGSGTPGSWNAVLAIPPPDAAVEVTLRAYSFSAADGSMENLVERPVSLAADRPLIFITAPGCGAAVSAGTALAVSGRAFVFEAALTVELRDASGAAVATQTALAARGDEESPWSTTLAVPAGLAPGSYDLVAYDLSARDGAVENEFAIQVLVEP
jgi:hypothetical protein